MTCYFAYGSNMDLDAMRQRCPSARAMGQGRIADHRFVIAACGYASVEFEPGGTVFGLLWTLEPADEAALDIYEDVENGLYIKETCRILCPEGSLSALIYRVPEKGLGKPHDRYLEGVMAAARQIGLPEAYVDGLRIWL